MEVQRGVAANVAPAANDGGGHSQLSFTYRKQPGEQPSRDRRGGIVLAKLSCLPRGKSLPRMSLHSSPHAF